MIKIGVLSDTHSTVPEQAYSFFKECDELWHAGDVGRDVLDELRQFKPLRAVYGNIDDSSMHYILPQTDLFYREGLKIVMTHIGGYPSHYQPAVRRLLEEQRPDIFVCGHSHILRIMRDPALDNMLVINPGAAGRTGIHKKRTLVRFVIAPPDGQPTAPSIPQKLEILDFPR